MKFLYFFFIKIVLHFNINAIPQWRSKGGRWGRSAPGGTFWGAAKLRLYLKTENRKDTKKGRQKIGVKNNLGGGKKIFRGTKNFSAVENEEKKEVVQKKILG